MKKQKAFEDLIDKLYTGKKINSGELGKLIGDTCHYVKYVVVSEYEKESSIALIFPNKKLLEQPDYKLSPEEGCFYPRNLDELGRCLSGCLKLVNLQIKNNSSKLKAAAVINVDLSHENGAKSPSTIIEKYKKLLQEKQENNVPADEEIYFIKNI